MARNPQGKNYDQEGASTLTETMKTSARQIIMPSPRQPSSLESKQMSAANYKAIIDALEKAIGEVSYDKDPEELPTIRFYTRLLKLQITARGLLEKAEKREKEGGRLSK